MNFGTAGGKKTKNSQSNLIPIEFSMPQMITLAEDVSSWEIGDKIAIASTDFEQVIRPLKISARDNMKKLLCPLIISTFSCGQNRCLIISTPKISTFLKISTAFLP